MKIEKVDRTVGLFDDHLNNWETEKMSMLRTVVAASFSVSLIIGFSLPVWAQEATSGVGPGSSPAHNPRLYTYLQVRDFEKFSKGFYGYEPTRVANGLSHPAIYRDYQHPDNLMVAFDVTDRTKAGALMQSEGLLKGMTSAGVIRVVSYQFAE